MRTPKRRRIFQIFQDDAKRHTILTSIFFFFGGSELKNAGVVISNEVPKLYREGGGKYQQDNYSRLLKLVTGVQWSSKNIK
jgi:hypothetical protein